MTTVDELPEATGATGDNAAWRRLGWRQTLLLNLGPAVGAAVRGAPGGVMTRTRTRMTAGQRREMVLQAALAEFAARGLDGASTQDIARGAGISQPYPLRLVGTKKALFVSLVRPCFQHVAEAFARRPPARQARTRCRPSGAPSGSCASSGRSR